jgi:hypothetical protein
LGNSWIAVIGTLGGVALTAVAGLLTAVLVSRQQRAAAETQFRHETVQKVREERRTIFVEYLAAFDTALGKAHQVFTSPVQAVSNQAAGPQPFAAVAGPEMGRVNQAYLTVTITAMTETRQAARESVDALWKAGNAAMSGDETAYKLEVENAHGASRVLRAAMRKELDIE